jgi:hypothetical protein
MNWQEVEARAWFATEYFQQHSELAHLTLLLHLQLQAVAHPIPLHEHRQNVQVGMQQLHERTLLHLWTPSLPAKLRTMPLLQMKLSALLALLSPLLAFST